MAQTTDYKQMMIEKIRENYLSVALGVLVFLVAVTLIFRSGDAQKAEDAMEAKDTTLTEQTYVVQLGDSVSSIAREQLGSVDYADEIIAANNLQNPDAIEVGMKLTLPIVAGMEKEAEAQPSAAPSVAPTVATAMEGDLNGDGMTTSKKVSITGDTYTTVRGDHLWDIAERAYGDGNMYTRIIEANRDVLGNPDRLVEGIVLKLPRGGTK